MLLPIGQEDYTETPTPHIALRTLYREPLADFLLPLNIDVFIIMTDVKAMMFKRKSHGSRVPEDCCQL